jgi:hypothetical protein
MPLRNSGDQSRPIRRVKEVVGVGRGEGKLAMRFKILNPCQGGENSFRWLTTKTIE